MCVVKQSALMLMMLLSADGSASRTAYDYNAVDDGDYRDKYKRRAWDATTIYCVAYDDMASATKSTYPVREVASIARPRVQR